MAQLDTLTDEELIRQVLAGREMAYATLWARYSTAVRVVIQTKIGNSEDVEDAMAQLRWHLLMRLPRYRPCGHFRGWLLRMATNLAINHQRSMARVPMPHGEALPDTADDAPNPELQVVARFARLERTGAIVGALRGLDPDLSATVWLFWAGHDFQTIAATLGVPKATVATRLMRAKEQLGRVHFAIPG